MVVAGCAPAPLIRLEGRENMSIFLFIIAALLPVLFCIGFYLLEKYTAFGNLRYIWRQVVIGVVFGGLAILATEVLSIDVGGALSNVRDAARAPRKRDKANEEHQYRKEQTEDALWFCPFIHSSPPVVRYPSKHPRCETPFSAVYYSTPK